MSIVTRFIDYLLPTDMYQIGYDECMGDLISGDCNVKGVQAYLNSSLLSGNYSKYDQGVRAAMYDYKLNKPVICPDCFNVSAPGTIKCNYCGSAL